jgi:hypothetical protein
VPFLMSCGLSQYQAMRMRRIVGKNDEFTRRMAERFREARLPWERTKKTR